MSGGIELHKPFLSSKNPHSVFPRSCFLRLPRSSWEWRDPHQKISKCFLSNFKLCLPSSPSSHIQPIPLQRNPHPPSPATFSGATPPPSAAVPHRHRGAREIPLCWTSAMPWLEIHGRHMIHISIYRTYAFDLIWPLLKMGILQSYVMLCRPTQGFFVAMIGSCFGPDTRLPPCRSSESVPPSPPRARESAPWKWWFSWMTMVLKVS